MAINVTEMQRLAGVVPSDDGYRSYREAVGAEVLDEDIASGAKGWLSGVMKALGTWKEKLSKGGASTAQLASLNLVEQAITNALAKLGEAAGPVEAPDALEESDIPSYEAGGDLVAFNGALAKLLSKLKKSLGAKFVNQGYKGTGSKQYRRQVFVRLADDTAVDIWLNHGAAEIGGVMSLSGVDKSPIPYEGKTPQDVYNEIEKRLRAVQKKQESRTAGSTHEALETIHTDDIFGEHRNWVRALDGK